MPSQTGHLPARKLAERQAFAADAQDHSKTRVLVVDDQTAIADTLTIILNRHGFEATAAYSGEAAVSLVTAWKPGIVVSDIRMGKMNGIEAAVRIRRIDPACRIVLFSSNAVDLATGANIHHLGFELLRKPLHPELLLARLRAGAPGQASSPLRPPLRSTRDLP